MVQIVSGLILANNNGYLIYCIVQLTLVSQILSAKVIELNNSKLATSTTPDGLIFTFETMFFVQLSSIIRQMFRSTCEHNHI